MGILGLAVEILGLKLKLKVGASTKCVIIGPFPYQVFFELLKLCFGPSWHVFFEVHDALYNSNCIMD